MFEFIDVFTNWYMSHINYWTITIFMAVESSFIPFPSEIVIPPAAYKAANGELNMFLVLLCGSLGALIGALFNYFISFYLGRKLVYKFANTHLAHMLLIDQKGVEKSEAYFVKHGRSSTFIGRLVPGIRQLISIPAGLARMNLKDFVLFTVLGSTLWNIILAALGYFFYTQKEKLELYYKDLSIGLLAVGVLFIAYLIYKGFKKNNGK
ncbi:MAG TPA: DedA family protein [Bacteroidales bacterium]|nr:DedA family protein [Bacteroidales bacterium]